MEQFRHIGEVLGSLKALMVLRDEIQINQRQCCLIVDILNLAFETIADEIRQNLVLEERSTKWKPLEYPLRELCRVFKESEHYIRQCLDSKDWWGKAITLSHNNDCVEFQIHNLLCYFPAVIEAIENAGEISGHDQDEKEKKKVMLTRKYDMEWNDPKIFQWRFGKQYLVPREINKQLEDAWREDRWRLTEALKKKKGCDKVALTKNEQRLADMLIKELQNGPENLKKKLFPSAVLLGTKDYQVRRRLGRGSEFKEIQWLGQNFALRHVYGETQTLEAEISSLLCLSHPNILQYLCGFYDEEKKEFFLVMELMNRDLWSYMKDNCGPRRQILFSVPVVVDLMLQIARGMEYLHSRKIYHGDLNPCSILLKARNSQEGYVQAKVAGFGSWVKDDITRASPCQEEINPSIWYSPEVLTELERSGNASSSRYSEKADVYSFGMICFELLTGKVPFEDNHLQGDGFNRNIKAGERPLFPYPSPKYLVSLIKKCWQTDPAQRPTFSSICRILRYTKKFLAINTEFLVINPELNQLELQCPPVDYCDIEAMFLKNFRMEKASHLPSVSQIPYEMFSYKVVEKEKTSPSNIKDKSCESAKDETPKNEPLVYKEENDDQKKVCGDENAFIAEHPLPLATDTKLSGSNLHLVCSEPLAKKSVTIKLPIEEKAKKDQGTLKLQPTNSASRGLRTSKGNQLGLASSPGSPSRRRSSHVLDSKINIKGSQSRSVSSPSSSVRRKRIGHVSDSTSSSSLKMKTGNQSPLTRYGRVSDSKSRKGNQSPLIRYGHVSDSKMNKGSQSPLGCGTGRLRSSSTDTNLKMRSGNMSPYALSPFSTCTRRCGRVSDFEGVFKMNRGRLSPLTLSPLSPYVRTYGHISNSQRSSKPKRASLSPLTLSPLSPYVRRTSGHVSD